jgi:hypothetical protein
MSVERVPPLTRALTTGQNHRLCPVAGRSEIKTEKNCSEKYQYRLSGLSVAATTASTTAAETSAFSTTGAAPATGEVAFVSLTATASSATETSFTAAATATGSASPVTGFGLGLGFVDGNCPALQLLAVQAVNGRLSGFLAGHFNKTEAFGSATEFIHDYTD